MILDSVARRLIVCPSEFSLSWGNQIKSMGKSVTWSKAGNFTPSSQVCTQSFTESKEKSLFDLNDRQTVIEYTRSSKSVSPDKEYEKVHRILTSKRDSKEEEKERVIVKENRLQFPWRLPSSSHCRASLKETNVLLSALLFNGDCVSGDDYTHNFSLWTWNDDDGGLYGKSIYFERYWGSQEGFNA